MDQAQRKSILEGAMRAFFEALLAGYAGKRSDDPLIKRETCPDGYKKITWVDEDSTYSVEDRYCVNDSSTQSAGTTTVFFKGQPVWWMSYAGSYPDDVIPFLKRALSRAYESEVFWGGRGEPFYREEDCLLEYHNVVHDSATIFTRPIFSAFSGREMIVLRMSKDEISMQGFHNYMGMPLI